MAHAIQEKVTDLLIDKFGGNQFKIQREFGIHNIKITPEQFEEVAKTEGFERQPVEWPQSDGDGGNEYYLEKKAKDEDGDECYITLHYNDKEESIYTNMFYF